MEVKSEEGSGGSKRLSQLIPFPENAHFNGLSGRELQASTSLQRSRSQAAVRAKCRNLGEFWSRQPGRLPLLALAKLFFSS